MELQTRRNELLESKNGCADLYEHAPTGYLDLTPDGSITRANIAARGKLGFFPRFPPNLPFSQLIHIDDRAKFWKFMTHVANGGKGACTLRVVGKDGSVMIVLVELACELDENRKIKRWRLGFVDITEHKRNMEQLLEKEEQLRVELEAMTRLQRIGSIFATEGTLAPVLGEIVEAAVSISGADFGAIQLLDMETSTLRLVAHQGLSQGWADSWNAACQGRGACCVMLKHRKRAIVQDVEKSPMFIGAPALEIMLKAGIKTIQCTPLLSRSGALVGVFSTHYLTHKRLDERALRLLDMLARQTADIIERAQMVEELKRKEEKFRALVQASSDAIYQISPDWKELRRLFSSDLVSDAEGPGYWLNNCIHPDDRPGMLAKINEAIDNKSVFEHEYRFLHKDGSPGWRFARAIPLVDARGEIVEWFGAASDITQRKEAEDALRRSEERFRVAQELSPDGFTILRPVRDDAGSVIDFTWVYQNPAAARMSSIAPEEIVGRRLLDVVPELRASCFFEAYRHVSQTGETRVLEGQLACKRLPKPNWFRIVVVRMGGDDIAILAQDINVRKQTEEELQRSREELEKGVRERTASLEAANRKLRLVPSKLIEVQENERKRLAQDLHDSVGQTLAALKFRIEHITYGMGRSDTKEAKRLLDEFIPVLQRSIDETRTIYMGLKPTILIEHGLLAALEWYRHQLMAVYTRVHIELETEIEEGDIPEALKNSMFRIAQEALSNACKHSNAEWVGVSVALRDGNIELEISDDGKGMDLGSILESATGRSLGLVGMKERAEISGGTFYMESTLNEGVKVRAIWPATEILAEADI